MYLTKCYVLTAEAQSAQRHHPKLGERHYHDHT